MAATFDLDAELAKGAETPRHEITDTVARGGAAAELLGAGKAKIHPKITGQIRRAAKMIDAGQPEQGARILLKVLDAEPDLAVANQAMGLALEKLGRLSRALQFLERALKRDPGNADIYAALGSIAMKLGLLPTAEKFHRIQLQLAPKSATAVTSLAAALREQGKFADAVEVLRAAIYADQENPDLWNALGTSVLESGDIDQAITFYSEVLRLKPGYTRGHHNLARALELAGRVEDALPHYETSVEKALSEKDRVLSTHALAHACLASGRIARGWEMYGARLNPHYDMATRYLLPGEPWDGADPAALEGRTVLVMGEQGIGDEILFANALPDLIEAVGPEGEVRLACEQRLIPLFQRSFPGVRVGRHYTIEREGRQIRHAPDLWNEDEIDLWTPIGNLCRAFRGSLDAFPQRASFLTPDPERLSHWRSELGAMGTGPKIGVLWKSLKMDARRSKSFSPFELWKPVLKTPGITLVNLQYGDCAAELADAKDRFGVTIHQPGGIDLRNDLDDVAALSAACDLVIGPMNATTNIAAACGAEVWFLRVVMASWTLLGTQGMAWYPRTRTFAGEGYGDWIGAMKQVRTALEARIQGRDAA
jgi:tetratricopeptide (TPR) repeat protein